MIPGVSRSGATILGALSLGVERRTAAEFSFFLAIPTMLGASTLELFKYRDQRTSGMVRWSDIGGGFVISFLVALLVIKRSDTQKSELQSLLRISYADFCLKNKTISRL